MQSSSSTSFFQFHVNPDSYTLQYLVLNHGQELIDVDSEMAKEKPASAANELDWCVRPISRFRNYTVSLNCLATLPCHGLVDTGAQEGTVGLWHWQRWWPAWA